MLSLNHILCNVLLLLLLLLFQMVNTRLYQAAHLVFSASALCERAFPSRQLSLKIAQLLSAGNACPRSTACKWPPSFLYCYLWTPSTEWFKMVIAQKPRCWPTHWYQTWYLYVLNFCCRVKLNCRDFFESLRFLLSCCVMSNFQKIIKNPLQFPEKNHAIMQKEEYSQSWKRLTSC